MILLILLISLQLIRFIPFFSAHVILYSFVNAALCKCIVILYKHSVVYISRTVYILYLQVNNVYTPVLEMLNCYY